MSDFFDRVIDGIGKGVTAVSEKSKLALEKTNINSAIRSTEKNKEDAAKRLGTMVYELYKSGEVSIEQCDLLYKELNMLEKKIEELRNQLRQLDLGKTGDVYTTYTAHDTTADDGKVCECGAVNKPEASFCAKCGKTL